MGHIKSIDDVIIFTNGREEAIELETKLFKAGYTWFKHGIDSIFKNWGGDIDHLSFSVNKKDKKILCYDVFMGRSLNQTISSHQSGSNSNFLTPLDKEYSTINYDESKDLIDRLLGGNIPSYEPRKIIRESKNSDKPNIFNVVINTENREQSIELEDILFKAGYRWYLGDHEKYNKKLILEGTASGMSMSLLPDKRILGYRLPATSNIIKLHNNSASAMGINSKKKYILNFEKDRNLINSLLGIVPSYEPRKLIREGYINKKFLIFSDAYKETVDAENYLLNLGYRWTGFKKGEHMDAQYFINHINYFFFESDNEFNSYGRLPIGPEFYNEYVDYPVYSFIKDRSTIDRLLGIVPSYEPRKLIRENLTNKEFLIHSNPGKETEDAEQYLFDLGYRWDGFDKGKHLATSHADNYFFFIDDERFDSYENLPIGNPYPSKFKKYPVYEFEKDRGTIDKLMGRTPTYEPRKLIRESLNKILYAFDLDDTLVYSNTFEDTVKHLIKEDVSPEDMLIREIGKIGQTIDNIKYDNGRIYVDDPGHDIHIPENSYWIRRKDRVYITAPESFVLHSASLPIGVNEKIVKMYDDATYKCIITSRYDKLRNQIQNSMNKLNIEQPNMGLFMYPDNSPIFRAKWKADMIRKVCSENNFNEVHYYDDNIKILKKIKDFLTDSNINIYCYKVTKNEYRRI